MLSELMQMAEDIESGSPMERAAIIASARTALSAMQPDAAFVESGVIAHSDSDDSVRT